METVKVSCVWTKEELQRALRAQSRSTFHPRLLLFTKGFTFLLGALMVFLSVIGAPFDPIIYALILFCVYWTIFGGNGIAWWSSRKFKNSLYADKTFEWDFSEQKISFHCENITSSQSVWKVTSSIVATSDGLLLYESNRPYWLPYDGFETPDGIEKVKEFARANDLKVIEAKR